VHPAAVPSPPHAMILCSREMFRLQYLVGWTGTSLIVLITLSSIAISYSVSLLPGHIRTITNARRGVSHLPADGNK
jgi:hypothetical protein